MDATFIRSIGIDHSVAQTLTASGRTFTSILRRVMHPARREFRRHFAREISERGVASPSGLVKRLFEGARVIRVGVHNS